MTNKIDVHRQFSNTKITKMKHELVRRQKISTSDVKCLLKTPSHILLTELHKLYQCYNIALVHTDKWETHVSQLLWIR